MSGLGPRLGRPGAVHEASDVTNLRLQPVPVDLFESRPVAVPQRVHDLPGSACVGRPSGTNVCHITYGSFWKSPAGRRTTLDPPAEAVLVELAVVVSREDECVPAQLIWWWKRSIVQSQYRPHRVAGQGTVSEHGSCPLASLASGKCLGAECNGPQGPDVGPPRGGLFERWPCLVRRLAAAGRRWTTAC